ncbi:TetR/AcrR family transcriptional regulator [Gordonia humi]|uniref:AcrR family transcriptional regulator n=1 Tax=Gordonia humi TaxID=686429 RepID=A0A840F1R3_9ACTN|nr:TetR/AcrR family transcriptional regulator [Gordonia humi]MBB4135906.1 AcrR family transcriptional regulator [Gordonia humi]
MTPSPRARLTMPAIVDAAIALADEDGIGALSMRKLADRLGAGTMSLYRHVADKDQLIGAMADVAGAAFAYPLDDAGLWTWRERVRIAVDRDWALFERHPWMVLAYAAPRYTLSATSRASLAWLADGLTDLGVDHDEATTMALSVWDLTNGVALMLTTDRLLNADPPLTSAPEGLKERLDAGVESLCLGFAARGAGPSQVE